MRSTTISLQGVGLISAASQVVGYVTPAKAAIQTNTSYPFADIDIDDVYPVYMRDTKVPLRILPFGASIVFGIGSTLPGDDSKSGNG